MLSGMITCVPLSKLPSSTESSSRNAQCERLLVGSSFIVLGHPVTIVSECSENLMILRLVSQFLDSFIGESDEVNSNIKVDSFLVVNARKS